MAVHPLRAMLAPLNVIDLLSFLPCLLEATPLFGVVPQLRGWGVDLKWARVFRALRLLRLTLLTGNLPSMKLSRSALLSGAFNVRLLQLTASVAALLFTASSIIHVLERLPFHDALYFVTTSLTTVGYGDVVVRSVLGKLTVVAMILVGAVIIPVRFSQLYSQMSVRREAVGPLPSARRPFVILSTRLSEVRGFSDLFTEFFRQVRQAAAAQANHSRAAATAAATAAAATAAAQPQQHQDDLQLVVLSPHKPSFEFRAFQELNEWRLSLVEGSLFRDSDLLRCRAADAQAVMVLADRFTSNVAKEDLDVLFRVSEQANCIHSASGCCAAWASVRAYSCSRSFAPPFSAASRTYSF